MKSKKGKSLCIFSAKGGVGKSITTLNLAGVFAELDKKVLIIDLDTTSGGIALALNIPFKKSIYNLWADLNNNRYQKFAKYITKYNENISFLASPKDPRQGTKITAKFIDLIIDRAEFMYDVILIDTNHYLNEINLVTLDKVQNILFVVSNDPMDLKNMKSLISIFTEVNILNFKVLLNASINPYKDYFASSDIENVIGVNVDYVLSNKFFIKNIDDYIMNGEIPTLDKKVIGSYTADCSTLMTIASDILGSSDEVKKDE